MSRIAKTPISIPAGVTAEVSGEVVTVKGPKGSLSLTLPPGVKVSQTANILTVEVKSKERNTIALSGFVRSSLANMVHGLTTGWTKTLELSGVGYRATMAGAGISLSVGFSHPVVIEPPVGIQFSIQESKIVITGADKQLVGQVAANIRNVRKPEPYKGKGIKYTGEYIRKKAGKTAKAVGGTK